MMNHPHHHQHLHLHPTLLALRRGNSTPAASSVPSDDDSLPHPHPLHALSFPNGITKLCPPPIVVADPSSTPLLLSSYSSLKDFLPPSSSPQVLCSPTTSISIRHRLVKQAAWAYLQPAAVSPVSPPVPSFRRLCSSFSSCFRRLFSFFSGLLRRFFLSGPVRSSR
ncbi:hypothetical protein MLD38_018528 [Melastoma candidum]|uniref:Uncharacterized protein n=1 Tax=Melastoma candidum TaxID=119954 RepID=A0ACB9QW06_9MYRT|nr:hypothetical protein MLD38_018528 [Melastoma candidum]